MRTISPILVAALFTFGCGDSVTNVKVSSPVANTNLTALSTMPTVTPKTQPMPSPTAKIVANTNDVVRDTKAKYLATATAYLDKLFEADKAMTQQMAKAGEGTTNLNDLIGSMRNGALTEKNGYAQLEAPPIAYRSIQSKLTKIHNGHVAAYFEYIAALSTLLTHEPEKGTKRLDRGDVILIDSVQLLNNTRDILIATRERDVNR